MWQELCEPEFDARIPIVTSLAVGRMLAGTKTVAEAWKLPQFDVPRKALDQGYPIALCGGARSIQNGSSAWASDVAALCDIVGVGRPEAALLLRHAFKFMLGDHVTRKSAYKRFLAVAKPMIRDPEPITSTRGIPKQQLQNAAKQAERKRFFSRCCHPAFLEIPMLEWLLFITVLGVMIWFYYTNVLRPNTNAPKPALEQLMVPDDHLMMDPEVEFVERDDGKVYIDMFDKFAKSMGEAIEHSGIRDQLIESERQEYEVDPEEM